MLQIITEQTTLGQLTIERAKLGIESLTITVRRDGSRLATALDADHRAFYGHGVTEAEAINDVFVEVAMLQVEGSR